MKMSEHNRVPKGNVRETELWFLPRLAEGLNTNQSINQSKSRFFQEVLFLQDEPPEHTLHAENQTL
jgi:hypothetical protein